MTRFRAMPYAKALHEVVQAKHPGRAEAVADELKRMTEAMAQVTELERVMVTPRVAVETKTAILDEVLSALAIEEPTRRFLHVVQRHYRLAQLPQIQTTYGELLDRALGRTQARIEVARPLSPVEREATLAVISEVTGATVVANLVESRELLAGVRVQIGSKIFDGSLLAQLERLSRQSRFV